MYETVGRSRNCVDGPRAALCSRHGRSNSLSPGRARYAAGQLCSTARLRRPLMLPADSETAPAVELTAGPITSTDEELAAASSASLALRHNADQSASSTVDDAVVNAAQGAISATDSTEVCDLTSAEQNNVDSQLGKVPLPDNADGDAKYSEPSAETERLSVAVTDSHDLPTDAERGVEKNINVDELVYVKSETQEQTVEGCCGVRTLNHDETAATKNDRNDVTDDVVDGDRVVGEICSKDWVTAVDGEWCSKSPVISFDQTDTVSTKFDSSALEKILSSLSATSRRNHDDVTTNNSRNDNNHDDEEEDDDKIWMRHDVDDVACQSSLSMLDAAVSQLDNGLHFKSTRRRSSSSSSSSSVGHCSPSCLIPPSTRDADTDTSSASLLLTCSTKVDTLTDTATTSASTVATNLPSTSTCVDTTETAKSSHTAG